MNRIFGNFVSGRPAMGLLVVRLVFGLGLMLHGLQKLHSPSGPFAWMPPGSGIPAFAQGLATLAEAGGGLAVALGLLTPLAALGIAFNMLVAIVTVHVKMGHPFVSQGGKPSIESAAGYLAVALLVLLAGPGEFSLDAVLFGRRRAAFDEAH